MTLEERIDELLAGLPTLEDVLADLPTVEDLLEDLTPAPEPPEPRPRFIILKAA